MKIEKFEDVLARQEARILTTKTYGLTDRLSFKGDQGLSTQIQKACLSIVANIAEGFDRQSKRGFVKFLYYASGSTSEVQSHQMWIFRMSIARRGKRKT